MYRHHPTGLPQELGLAAFVLLVLLAAACGGGGQPSCFNAVQDGTETDVDCGGACQPCAEGRICLADADCASGNCTEGRCAAEPSCDDRIWNGTESDVDCGGSCPPCATGSKCTGHTDCISATCVNGLCRDPACDDGIQNGTETDTDCGGGCQPCADGAACSESSDCESLSCSAGVCQAASCADGIANGNESDTDCGGSCPPCDDGQACRVWSDCRSGNCVERVCAPEASCDDGVRNGSETDVDCGGGDCPACPNGAGCASGGDCASGYCDGGVCSLPASCGNHTWDGDETDVDCGGSCSPCATGSKCIEHSDCISATCINGICRDPACDDGIRNGTETDVDCGGGCPPCADGLHCLVPADCLDGVCSGGTCQEPSCTDGVMNGDEAGVDCGGSCPACPPECGNGIVEPPDEECEPGEAIDATCADYGFSGPGIACTAGCKIDISGCGCTWQVETVASPITRPNGTNDTQAGQTAISVDGLGRVHVVFLDSGEGAVRHAMKDANGWTFDVVAANPGGIKAVAVDTDSSNRAHVVYMDCDAQKVFHSVLDSGAWTTEEVASTQAYCVDVAMQIDDADAVHIAYTHASTTFSKPYVSYANNSSGGWVLKIWEPGVTDGFPRAVDIAVDVFGGVHIVYGHKNQMTDFYNLEPRYITNSSGLWKVFYLFRLKDRYVGYHASVDTDSRGAAWISYYDLDLGRLLVSTNTSGSLPPAEEVDDAGDVGLYTALSVTSDDLPHVLYMDADNDQLKHAWWDGASWSTEIVDTDGATGRDVDMVAVGRELHASYTSVAPQMELRYAHMVCPQ